MYAVFRTGGKQYRAAKGDVLRLEKIEGDEGASVKFDDVLLIGEGSDIKVGNPVLKGSSVSAKVIRQGKSRKVPVVKFKRRQNYLRQGTHRQFFTEVEITGISGSSAGKAEAKPAAAETAPKKKVAAKKATAKKAATKKPAAKKKAAKKKVTKKASD
jgi:large subunit ribosomal protein L21